MTSPRYRRLAHACLAVSQLDCSRAFYATLPGFSPAGSAVDAASFQVGDERSRLDLAGGLAPGLKRVGFEMENAGDLDALVASLQRHGHAWTFAGEGVRVIEPYVRLVIDFEPPREAARAEPGDIAGIGHVVIRSPGYRESVAFWSDVLGFRVSDEIDGRISFLRCFPNPLHHSLAIVPGSRPRFHHLNIRARAATDIERFARDLDGRGVRIVHGPGRHMPTGSRFVYFLDPDGLTLELSAAGEYFDEHAPRAARVLADRPESFDDRPALRHPCMYAVGEIEEATGFG